MPTKRRVEKTRPHRITPEALAAFDAGDHMRLHRALGLRPWQPSPLEASDGPSPWPAGSSGAVAWAPVCDLRGKLDAGSAARKQDRR
jgi:hypothetical protein